jgi:hypothetical protein
VIYFKSVLIGIGVAVLGCVIVPIARVAWATRKARIGGMTIGFSLIDVAHYWVFWVCCILLFIGGFASSLFVLKK